MLYKALKDISILLVEDNEMNTLLALQSFSEPCEYGRHNGMEAIDLSGKKI